MKCKECRFTPCTQAQEVDCCSECNFKCSSQCDLSKRKGVNNMNVKTKKSEEAKSRFIKVTRAHQFEDGSIAFDMEVDDITIYNNTLREGKNGTFVSFPSRKGKDGKYYSYVKCDLSREDVENIIEQIEKL